MTASSGSTRSRPSSRRFEKSNTDQAWSKEDALAEMNDAAFHHSGWFRNLDRYVSRADVASLRLALGIKAPASPASVRTSAAASAAGALFTSAAIERRLLQKSTRARSGAVEKVVTRAMRTIIAKTLGERIPSS